MKNTSNEILGDGLPASEFKEIFALKNGNRVLELNGELYMEIGGVIFKEGALPEDLKFEEKQLQVGLERRQALLEAVYGYKKTGTDE